MTSRSKLTLAVVAAVVVAAGSWFLWPDPGAAPMRTAETAESPPDPPAAEPSDPRPAAQAEAGTRTATRSTPLFVDRALGHLPAIEADVAPAGGVVSGRLAWQPVGNPVAGARVSLSREPLDTLVAPDPIDVPIDHRGEGAPVDDDSGDDDPLVGIATTTDAEGRFVLAGVPWDDDLFLRFDLPRGGAELHELRRRPEPGVETWQGEFWIDARGGLTGTVAAPDGTPIAGAHVRAVDEFRFDDAEVPESARRARRTDLGTVQRDGFDVDRPRSHADRARDRRLPFPGTRSDPDGRFTIPGVRAGRVMLVVTHGDHDGVAVPVVVVPERVTETGTVALTDGTTVTVRVVDADGTPVPRLAVAIRQDALRFGPPPRTTDAAGQARFVLPGLARDDLEDRRRRADDAKRAGRTVPDQLDWYSVFARRGPGMPWGRIGGGLGTEETFTLEPRIDLRFRVASSVGARIEPRFAFVPDHPHLRVETDPGGYRVVGAIPGADAGTTLVVTADGHAPAAVNGIATLAERQVRATRLDPPGTPPLGPVTVTMRGTVDTELKVVGSGGRPHPQAVIEVDLLGDGLATLPRRIPLGTTDAEGRLPVEGLWPGSFRFWMRDADGRLRQGPITAFRGETPLVVEFPDPAAIEGDLRRGGGLVSRRFRVVARHVPPMGREAEQRPPVETVSTDEGRYRLEGLVPGRWIVAVTEPRPPRTRIHAELAFEAEAHATTSVVLAVGTEQAVDFELDRSLASDPATVVGRVTTTLDPSTCTVELTGIRRGGRYTVDKAVPFADGTFRMTGRRLPLEPQLAVRVRLESGELTLPPVDLDDVARAAQDGTPSVELRVDTGGVTATLTDPKGTSLAGRMVELTMPGGAGVLTLVADATATIEADVLPAGEYAAWVRDGRDRIELRPLRIPAGDRVFVTLEPR